MRNWKICWTERLTLEDNINFVDSSRISKNFTEFLFLKNFHGGCSDDGSCSGRGESRSLSLLILMELRVFGKSVGQKD